LVLGVGPTGLLAFGGGALARLAAGRAVVFESWMWSTIDIQRCLGNGVVWIYARALRGELRGFTGANDPYEEPLSPDLVLDNAAPLPERNAEVLVNFVLERVGHGVSRG